MTDTEFRHAVPCFCAIPCSTNCRPMLFILHSGSLSGDARAIAENTCRSVKGELGLTDSIGVSFNRVFAKRGSDTKKGCGKSFPFSFRIQDADLGHMTSLPVLFRATSVATTYEENQNRRQAEPMIAALGIFSAR